MSIAAKGLMTALLKRVEGAEYAMLTIMVKVDAPPGQAIGIKEDLAMFLERFGDARVVEIREDVPRQMTIGGNR